MHASCVGPTGSRTQDPHTMVNIDRIKTAFKIRQFISRSLLRRKPQCEVLAALLWIRGALAPFAEAFLVRASTSTLLRM